jgi:RNA polymerase sigma factor (sigma-70 family)
VHSYFGALEDDFLRQVKQKNYSALFQHKYRIPENTFPLLRFKYLGFLIRWFTLQMTTNTQLLPEISATDQEKILIEKLKSRDEKALSLLYDKYAAALYGMILKIVKREELAEDVLQESFIKIWSSISQYDASRGRLFTWMLNICRNHAIDKIRSGAYRVSLKTQDITNTNSKAWSGEMQIRPDHIGLKEITEKLHPDQKQIIDLLYFEGYTQSEVAEALNLPLGTVKTRARNAIIFLSKLIK